MNKSKIYRASKKSKLSIDLYSSSIEAGFPSPADDHLDISLDLNKYLIKHPASTFYIYVKGDSMIDDGILDGDYIVVKKSEIARAGDTVVAILNGEATLKRYYIGENGIELHPRNSKYNTIYVSTEDQLYIQGQVLGVFREYN